MSSDKQTDVAMTADEALNVKWHTMKYEGDEKLNLLLRINSFNEGYLVSSFYAAYIHSPLVIVYFIFSICMMILLLKNKLISFVHLIVLVSTFLTIIPALLVAPFKVIFYHFANQTAPIPYPWCLIYVILEEFIPKITFIISLFLKVLLSINRACSVYFPFKMKFWFSKSRKRYMCSGIILSFSIILCFVNYIFFPIDETIGFGDLWDSGVIRVYRACSMLRSSVKLNEQWESSQNYIAITEFSLLFIGSVTLTFFNISFMIKIKKQRKQRKLIMDPNNNNINGNDRLQRMNKIYLWVALATGLIEIPLNVAVFVAAWIVFSPTLADSTIVLVHDIAQVILKITMPFDLFIFAILSEKIKTAIKNIFFPK